MIVGIPPPPPSDNFIADSDDVIETDIREGGGVPCFSPNKKAHALNVVPGGRHKLFIYTTKLVPGQPTLGERNLEVPI